MSRCLAQAQVASALRDSRPPVLLVVVEAVNPPLIRPRLSGRRAMLTDPTITV